MENKYLQVGKENILKKIINFIKGIFGKKEEPKDNIEMKKAEKESEATNFFDTIKVVKDEDKEMIALQNKYENNEVNLSSLSDEEISELSELYKRQVSDLKKKLEDKKQQLEIAKKRIENYSSNI